MTININNQQKEVAVGSTLLELLTQLHIISKGIAIAVNDTVVPKRDWEMTTVDPNDTITIIQATQGG